MNLHKTLEQQRAELNEQYLHTVSVLLQRQAVSSTDEFMLIQEKKRNLWSKCEVASFSGVASQDEKSFYEFVSC